MQRRINAKPLPGGRPGFRVTFRHPLRKDVVTKSLGTHDQSEAQGICDDLSRLCTRPELWRDENNPELGDFHKRTLEIFFGENSGALKALQRRGGAVDRAQVKGLVQRILTGAKVGESARAALLTAVERVTRELREEAADLRKQRNEWRERFQHLSIEHAALRRKHNLHTTATVGEAYDAWTGFYKTGRRYQTYQNATYAVSSFIAALAQQRKMRLGDVAPKHINDWLASLKKKVYTLQGRKKVYIDSTADLAAQTKVKYKRCLSTFFEWAVVQYGLSENPVVRALEVGGAARYAENIVAIRREEQILELLDALQPWPYWRAWVAVAILAGPRWAEQVWLKVDDVYLEEHYLRVTARQPGRTARKVGTKTGRERNVPIELTTLKPILEKYIEQRRKEKHRQPWLFPSTLDDHPYMKRTKTVAGIWSSNSTFAGEWERISKLAKPKGWSEERWADSFFAYGPAEWRHCYGTARGATGASALEISWAMGNSEEVCRRHYVAPSTTGKRWSFKW